MKLHKERSRLKVRANIFGNRVVNAWNQLSEDFVIPPSLNAFNGRLDKHWSRHPSKFFPLAMSLAQQPDIETIIEMFQKPIYLLLV